MGRAAISNMHSRSVFLVLTFLLSYAFAHDFKVCGAGDALGITKVSVTPDSPIPGQSLTVAFTATPKQDVVAGDKYTITVKVFGVALGHVDFDFCTELGVTCPVKAGTAGVEFAATYDVPSAAPGGVPLTAEFTGTTGTGTPFSCVDVDVTMGSPGTEIKAMLIQQQPERVNEDAWAAVTPIMEPQGSFSTNCNQDDPDAANCLHSIGSNGHCYQASQRLVLQFSDNSGAPIVKGDCKDAGYTTPHPSSGDFARSEWSKPLNVHIVELDTY